MQDKNQKTKHYTKDGISFDYPENWEIANATTANAIAAVADPKTRDPKTGFSSTVVVIQKETIPAGYTLKDVYDQNYAIFFNNSSYQRVYEGNTTINGIKVYENIYTVDTDNVQKQQRALWFEKKGVVYVILCSALKKDFKSQEANFNLIINSLKLR